MISPITKKYFSTRTDWDLNLNELAQLINERKSQGLEILDLTESNPTRCGFEYPTEAITKALTQPENFIYNPSPKGQIHAREAVVSYYLEQGVVLDPEQIFLTSSTSEAYSLIFRLLCNPGDSVWVPSPSYPLFGFLADLNDIELQSYELMADQNWKIDFSSLEKIITNTTKAILLVNPNNPTSSYIQQEEMEKLIRLSQEKEWALISDEVFFDYSFASLKKISLIKTNTVLTFTLNGLSKILGLPQMKLGWMVVNGPENLKKEAIERLEVIADTYLSVNTPIQNALPQILPLRNQIQDQIKNRVQLNFRFLKEILSTHSQIEVLNMDGGWYAILKIQECDNEDEWTLQLLKEKGVLIHPGHFYNFLESGYFVISLLTPCQFFEEGIKRMSHFKVRNTKHGA